MISKYGVSIVVKFMVLVVCFMFFRGKDLKVSIVFGFRVFFDGIGVLGYFFSILVVFMVWFKVFVFFVVRCENVMFFLLVDISVVCFVLRNLR